MGDQGSIPGSQRSPGEGNGNPLLHSCLENSMDGGAWWATVHGIAEVLMTEELHGILRARILEWVAFPCSSPALHGDSLPAEPRAKPKITECIAISYSRGSSASRTCTWVCCTTGDPLPSRPPGTPEPPEKPLTVIRSRYLSL